MKHCFAEIAAIHGFENNLLAFGAKLSLSQFISLFMIISFSAVGYFPSASDFARSISRAPSRDA